MNPPTIMIAEKIILQPIPARKITKMPDVAIRIEVPRSGCLATKIVGTIIIAKEITSVLSEGGRGRLPI